METSSGITLAERMDAGLVLAQSERPIEPGQTAGELHDLLAADGPELIERVLASHAAGTLTAAEQDESLVTLAPKLSRADAWIDFAQPATDCHNRVHGLSPWPGVAAMYRDAPLKLRRVEARDAAAGEPGTLIDAEAGLIACGGGTALRLIEIQPAGKRPMPWPDFARGRRAETGERLIGTRPS